MTTSSSSDLSLSAWADRSLALNQGPAVAFNGRWADWSDIRQFAARFDAAVAGFPSEAPVCFFPRNHPASLATLLALLRQRRTIRMGYPFQSPAGILRDILRSPPAFVVLDESDGTATIGDALANAGIGLVTIADLIDGPVHRLPCRNPASPDDQPRIEIQTSGTTGPPKPFIVAQSMLAGHLVAGSPLAAMAPAAVAALPPALLFFPIGNISGLYSTLPPLLFGQRVVLLERFTISAWRDYVVRHRPAMAGMPAAGVRMLLDANIDRADLSSLRALGTGAAPLPADIHRRFEERYGIPILLSYGATEFGGPVTAMTLDLHREWGQRKFGSVGRPLPGVRLRIVDAVTGVEQPPDTEGLLEVVSPRIGPDWLRTSDLAVIDGDGFLFHRGRADGAIMRGGFKLLPETIEDALLRHPLIKEAAVVGMPDQRLGEVPGALLVVRDGQTPPEASALESHLRQLLPATHLPAVWRFRPALPHTVSHKIDRACVRRILSGSEE